VGCWGDLSAGGTVSAAPSSSTTVRRHRRGDRLLRAMHDPLDMSADAMLEDTEDLHIASAVAAHLQALRHWRKRARGSRVSRRPRYVGSVPDRRPNKRRNFRSGLRAILRDYSRNVRAIPWPSGRWRARRRIDTGHADRLHSRKRARGHVQPSCRGGGGVGRGKGRRRRRRSGGGPPASREADGRGRHSAAQHLRTAGGAADTAHGRAGGTDCRATGRL